MLEREFVALGHHFEPLTDKMLVLVGSSDGLSSLASGREGGQTLFQKAVSLLHGPLDYIESCVAQQPRLLSLLSGCADEMHRMLGYQARLQDILAPLAFVEILFKVESASLDIEQRETFATVAADIQHLRNLVNEAFRSNATMLASTHATLVSVRRKLESDFQTHARATAEKRQRIQSALARLDEQLLSNVQRDNDANSLSRRLATHVGTVVGGVQYQDIVMQKCAHVTAALDKWRQEGGSDLTLLRLQVAQLEAVRADIDKAVAEIEGGINEIHSLARAIDDRCTAQDDFQGMIAAADGMVQLLLDAMKETREIIVSSADLLRDAHTAVLPAGDIAKSMTTALGELSVNMKLVALNAQVRSVQLSQGTGLEVLAVRTSEISSRITAISTDVANHLGQLRTVTDEMFALFEDFQRRGEEQQQGMAKECAPIESQLHHLRDQTLIVFSSIGDAVDSVRKIADDAKVNLQSVGEARQTLDQTIEGLRGIVQTSVVDADVARPLGQGVDVHARHYTMASERRVHEAVLGGSAATTLASDSSSGAIEIFGETSCDSLVGPTEGQVTNRIEPKESTSTRTPSEFGDNVDLF